MNSLASAIQHALLPLPGVTRLTTLRRGSALFAQGQPAESLYFIAEGLVKLTRSNDSGGRIILTMRGAGHVIGEEALASPHEVYYTDAEVLTPAVAYNIPRAVVSQALSTDHQLASALIGYLLERRMALAEKVELLCLRDVEYRILHYLAELSAVVTPVIDGEGYQLPITQLELADLIGATRETTSTTLNQLERRGLIKLSRRMLTVPSPEQLRDAALVRASSQSANA